jgi:molybdopterin converting factor subunit 1
VKVSLLLFAGLRDAIGQRHVRLELAEGSTVMDLIGSLEAEYPPLGPLLQRVVCAIDEEYVAREARLHDGAEVALIPPVSGGSREDRLFRVTHDPLEAGELVELVRRDEAGAVALFYGVVRNHNEGRQVERLEYEAHEPMAVRMMGQVAQETRARFPDICRIGVWHRVGTLEIGDTSLLVAVSSGHRQQAFEACHWAVDRVKEIVPVWKKEHWAGGSAWLEGHAIDRG